MAVAYQDGLPIRRRSPIQVLTGPGIEYLRWSTQQRYHYTKPLPSDSTLLVTFANYWVLILHFSLLCSAFIVFCYEFAFLTVIMLLLIQQLMMKIRGLYSPVLLSHCLHSLFSHLDHLFQLHRCVLSVFSSYATYIKWAYDALMWMRKVIWPIKDIFTNIQRFFVDFGGLLPKQGKLAKWLLNSCVYMQFLWAVTQSKLMTCLSCPTWSYIHRVSKKTVPVLFFE